MKQLPVSDCVECKHVGGGIKMKCYHPAFGLVGMDLPPRQINGEIIPSWCPLDDYQKPLGPEVK